MWRGKKSVVCVAALIPIPCHVALLSWQELEEELDKLLLMKVSDRNLNIKVIIVGLT